MSKKTNLVKSFSFAFQGIKEAYNNEPNFKIHLAVGSISLVLAGLSNFTTLEWLILVLTISLVLTLELVNTSIESLADLLSPQIQDRAKIAKDVLAGAVFLATFAASLIGAILFVPKIISLFLY